MVDLTYFHGQELVEIIQGEEPWQWALKLGGDAIIKNWDERRTSVPEIERGVGFLLTIYEETQTQLVFGTVDAATNTPNEAGRVIFTPTQYSITDPVYAAEEQFPQRNIDELVQEVKAKYPDHLLAREQDGPDHDRPQEDEIGTNEAEAEDSASSDDD